MKTFDTMTTERLEELLADFSRARIAVLGDFFLAILIMVAMVFVVMICSMIPFLGFFISIASTFYLYYLVYFALFGSVCADAFGEAETLPTASPPPSA